MNPVEGDLLWGNPIKRLLNSDKHNDVQIETLQTLSVHPREKLAQIQEVFDRGNNIWFVSIAGYQYYSIKFTTEQIEKVSPGGIEILKLKPVEITDPFWTEVDKKNYKINYQIPSQLQEIYYLNGLEWGEQGLFLSEKLQAGTVTHVLKFMETDKQGRRIEILPAELVISGNLLGDELTKATLEVSANGKDFTTVTELSSGSFQEKIALKDISPVWLSHLIWLRLTVDSTNQAIIENLEVQSKDKLPLTWGAVDIANFSANPLPIIDDNLSTNSVALRNESTAGPYINLEPGQYEATFHLRVLQVTPNDPSMLDVVIGGGSRTLAETIINETTSNNYKEFRLDFEIDEPTQIEARLKYNQYDDIWFDYLIIKPR